MKVLNRVIRSAVSKVVNPAVVQIGTLLNYVIQWGFWTEDEVDYFVTEDGLDYFVTEDNN